jgi:hypothetical protein
VKVWEKDNHIKVERTEDGVKITAGIHADDDRKIPAPPAVPVRGKSRAAVTRKIPAPIAVTDAPPSVPAAEPARAVDVTYARVLEPPPAPAVRRETITAGDITAYGAAIMLAACAAYFSLRGLIVLFPGSTTAVVWLGLSREAGKLITAGWLAAHWRGIVWFWRLVLLTLIAGLAIVNATGLFSQLVWLHVGQHSAAAATIEAKAGEIDAKIELSSSKVADLDK